MVIGRGLGDNPMGTSDSLVEDVRHLRASGSVSSFLRLKLRGDVFLCGCEAESCWHKSGDDAAICRRGELRQRQRNPARAPPWDGALTCPILNDTI